MAAVGRDVEFVQIHAIFCQEELEKGQDLSHPGPCLQCALPGHTTHTHTHLLCLAGSNLVLGDPHPTLGIAIVPSTRHHQHLCWTRLLCCKHWQSQAWDVNLSRKSLLPARHVKFVCGMVGKGTLQASAQREKS